MHVQSLQSLSLHLFMQQQDKKVIRILEVEKKIFLSSLQPSTVATLNGLLVLSAV